MTPDELQFFDGRPGALALYERFRARLFEGTPDVDVRVHRTQITFSAGCGFAFVSFTPVRRAAERGPDWITVSFGLPARADSPRVDAAVQVRPSRWTHHVLIDDPAEIDDELAALIAEAAAFARRPRRMRPVEGSDDA